MTCRLKIEDLRDGHTFVIPVFEFSHLSFLCLKPTLDTFDLEEKAVEFSTDRYGIIYQTS